MRFSTPVIGALLLAAGSVVALPQPGLDIHISFSDIEEAGAEKVVAVPTSASDDVVAQTSRFFSKVKEAAHDMIVLGHEDKVYDIKGPGQYEYLKDTPDKLVVVQFVAEWCAPCRAITHKFSGFSKKYDDRTVFMNVDIDKLPMIPDVQRVRALPTYMFFKNRDQVFELTGANPSRLQHAIDSNL